MWQKIVSKQCFYRVCKLEYFNKNNLLRAQLFMTDYLYEISMF